MPFAKQLPEWNAIGVEPPQSLKDAGWKPTQKPPADYFNWYMYNTYQALLELQQKAALKDEIAAPKDASTTQKGVVQLNDTTNSTSTTQAATANAVKTVNDALASHSAETAQQFTNMNINMIDMAVELETLKRATLNGVASNIFIETFQTIDDINLFNGIYDSTNKRLFV